MGKPKCELCGRGKARRECRKKGGFICSLCCAKLRSVECEECRHFQVATWYNSSKPKKDKAKPFTIEINEEIESAVDNALDLVERGDIEKGRRMLEGLIKEHPGNHTVNYGLGAVHAFREQYDEAIECFTKATDIFPYFIEAHFNKGVAYKCKLDLKNAVKSFQEVVKIGDDRDELVRQAKDLVNSVEDHLLNEHNISMEAYFEGQERFEQAYLYMEEREWEKAIAGFRDCLAINKEHQQSYGNMGLCLAMLGRRSEALAALDMALDIAPDYEPAMVNREVIETLKEGEKLPQGTFKSVEYYKDYSVKRKSYIDSICSEDLDIGKGNINMRKVKVNINGLIDAMEITHEDLVSYLDTETGEVVEFWELDENGERLDPDEDDPYLYDERYIWIEPIESHEAYRFMQKFILTVKDKHLQELLKVAISGRGAFRRFKDVLSEYPEEEERWFSFKREIMRQWVIDWLKDEVYDINVPKQPCT